MGAACGQKSTSQCTDEATAEFEKMARTARVGKRQSMVDPKKKAPPVPQPKPPEPTEAEKAKAALHEAHMKELAEKAGPLVAALDELVPAVTALGQACKEGSGRSKHTMYKDKVVRPQEKMQVELEKVADCNSRGFTSEVGLKDVCHSLKELKTPLNNYLNKLQMFLSAVQKYVEHNSASSTNDNSAGEHGRCTPEVVEGSAKCTTLFDTVDGIWEDTKDKIHATTMMDEEEEEEDSTIKTSSTFSHPGMEEGKEL